MNNEIFEAMIEHCKQARRQPLPMTLHLESRGAEPRRYHGTSGIYRPYRPRWFLIENPSSGLSIEDVRFGACSQYVTHVGGVPAVLYSMADALAMKDSPIEAWKRFEIDSVDALHVGEPIQVFATFAENQGHPEPPDVIRCLWIGDEPKFRKWEAEVAGTMHMVGMSANGPFVKVQTRMGESITVPIKPSDITYLMDKIGKPVKFTLETGDDR